MIKPARILKDYSIRKINKLIRGLGLLGIWTVKLTALGQSRVEVVF